MKINNREELYSYLNSIDINEKIDNNLSTVYFLVTYDNDKQEPVYFMPYKDVFFESDCMLYGYETTEENIKKYVKEQYETEYFEESLEYELTMFRDGIHYQIENFQFSPWINKLKDIKMISETECLSWLIEHQNKDYISKL